MSDTPVNSTNRPQSAPSQSVARVTETPSTPAAGVITSEQGPASQTASKKTATKGQQTLPPAQELDVLTRARYPIIYVTTWEEERVERCLREIAKRREKNLFIWTITDGIVKAGAEPSRN